MKKIFYNFSVALFSLAIVSCQDPNKQGPENTDDKMQAINEAFVDEIVVPTYKNLADKSLDLQTALESLKSNPSDAQVEAACALWVSARQYWEWSEAFLFGAASKYAIDPHIDTWPLDQTRLDALLKSELFQQDPAGTIADMNNGLVGFHGLEYIIFREGRPRKMEVITPVELDYAIAVAADLALSCIRLEAAWANNVSDEKAAILAEAEMEPEDNFGDMMKNAGQAGSIWRSVALGTEQIIEGCKTIVDEVAMSKIGSPYYQEDINNIESPHAYNSIQDFYDNIKGVQSVYFGEMNANKSLSTSISALVKSIDSDLDAEVQNALDDCLAAINEMPKPFVLNYTDAKVEAAIEACDALLIKLEEVRQCIMQ